MTADCCLAVCLSCSTVMLLPHQVSLFFVCCVWIKSYFVKEIRNFLVLYISWRWFWDAHFIWTEKSETFVSPSTFTSHGLNLWFRSTLYVERWSLIRHHFICWLVRRRWAQTVREQNESVVQSLSNQKQERHSGHDRRNYRTVTSANQNANTASFILCIVGFIPTNCLFWDKLSCSLQIMWKKTLWINQWECRIHKKHQFYFK